MTTAPKVSTSCVPTPYFLVSVYFSVPTYSLSVGAESRGVPPGERPTGAESHVDPPPIPSIGDKSHGVPPMNPIGGPSCQGASSILWCAQVLAVGSEHKSFVKSDEGCL